MKDIEALSDLMDAKFKILGIRFGLDSLIGLIPVAGDVVTSGISFYIVLRAFVMGFPLIVIFRMLINVIIDYILGAVPVLGNIFDFIWKANQRNVLIMKSYSESPKDTKKRSGFLLLSFVFLTASLFFLIIAAVFKILSIAFGLIFNFF